MTETKIQGWPPPIAMPRDSVVEMMEWLQMSEMAKLDVAMTSDSSRAALRDAFISGFIIAEGSKDATEIITRECLTWMELTRSFTL